MFGLLDVELKPATVSERIQNGGQVNVDGVAVEIRTKRYRDYTVDVSGRVDIADVLARAKELQRDLETSLELHRLWSAVGPMGDYKWSSALFDRYPNDLRRASARLDALKLVARAATLSVIDREAATITPAVRDARARAKKLTEEALALDSDNPEARYRLADLFMLEGKHQEAEAELRAALAREPRFAAARNKLGQGLEARGRHEEAIDEFREALKIDPAYAPARVSLGRALKAQGRLGEAIAELREAVRRNAGYLDGHTHLGAALAAQGDLAGAAAEFRFTISVDPDFAAGHYNLALVLISDRKFDEAIGELRQTTRLSPEHYDAQYQLGERLNANGDVTEAAKAYKEFLRLAPDTAEMQAKRDRARAIVNSSDKP
jgi:tetratricopeptide (TPR) repeat protein